MGSKKRKEEISTLTFLVPEPLINVQPFEITKDSWKNTQDLSKETHSLFTAYCTSYIIHRIQLLKAFPRYMSCFCVAWAVAVLWFLTQARWSYNRLFVHQRQCGDALHRQWMLTSSLYSTVSLYLFIKGRFGVKPPCRMVIWEEQI